MQMGKTILSSSLLLRRRWSKARRPLNLLIEPLTLQFDNLLSADTLSIALNLYMQSLLRRLFSLPLSPSLARWYHEMSSGDIKRSSILSEQETDIAHPLENRIFFVAWLVNIFIIFISRSRVIMRRRRFKMEECLRSEKNELSRSAHANFNYYIITVITRMFDYKASPLAVCSRRLLACCFNWANGGREKRTVLIELEQLYCAHGNPTVGGDGKHPLEVTAANILIILMVSLPKLGDCFRQIAKETSWNHQNLSRRSILRWHWTK